MAQTAASVAVVDLDSDHGLLAVRTKTLQLEEPDELLLLPMDNAQTQLAGPVR